MKANINTILGNITIQLYPEKVPITVENFITYVKDGFYENTIFHRVMKDFVIQGGGLDSNLKEKPTRESIKNEANNMLKNEYGTIAMARTSDPHSASSQFFINTNDNSFLDFTAETNDNWGYCVFGKIDGSDSIDIVNTIDGQETTTVSGYTDVPKQTILINNIHLVE